MVNVVFLLQAFITVLFAIVPLARAILYLASVIFSSRKIECLSNASYPRPTDIFLHVHSSDMYERGNETIYFCVKILVVIVFSVFGWCITKFWKKTCTKNTCTCEKNTEYLCCYLIAGLYLAFGWAVTVMEIIDLDGYYKNGTKYSTSPCKADLDCIRGILGAHHAFGFLLHLIEACILLSIIRVCASIQKIWKEAESEFKIYLNKDYDHYITYVNDCKQIYRKTYEKIEEMLKLHQTWFVLQWITYFFVSTTDLVYALRLILPTGFVHMHQSAYRFWMSYTIMFYIYEFASFMVPYACGGLMNHAHTKFYDKMRQKITSNFEAGKKTWTELTVEKDLKCDFVPTIIFVNIDVPINSPGYLISVLFDAFALVITLITSGQA